MTSTVSGRVPPHNVEAEEALVGSMLLGRERAAAALSSGVSSPDLYDTRLRSIVLAVELLGTAGAPVDTITVADQLQRAGSLDKIGGRQRLLELQASTPASANAGHYGAIVRDLALLRRAIEVAGDLADAGYDSQLDLVREIADDAPRRLQGPISASVDSLELDELLADAPPIDESKPWVIPGLLRRRERVVLTGGEGWGKSTLLRQLAICVASGLHPFTSMSVDGGPQNVLIIDLQEERADIIEALRPLRARAGDAYETGRLHFVSRSQGMNLLSAGDYRWLEALIAKRRPALLMIGPVRKMFRSTAEYSSKSSEEAVDELTRRLDDLRVAYDFSLILEAHAGVDRNESNFRVRGSTVWQDWPEYGIGLKPKETHPRRIVEIVDWRGRRHTGRPWPTKLVQGRGWPWKLDHDDYEALCRYLGLDWLVDGGTQEGLPV